MTEMTQGEIEQGEAEHGPWLSHSRLRQVWMPPDGEGPWVAWRYEDGSREAPGVEVRSAVLTWSLGIDGTCQLVEIEVEILDPITGLDRLIPCGLDLGQRRPPDWVRQLVERTERVAVDSVVRR